MVEAEREGAYLAGRICRARHLVTRFLADRRGATAIEYALIASGVGVAIAATVFSVGSTIETKLYDKVSDGLSGEPD